MKLFTTMLLVSTALLGCAATEEPPPFPDPGAGKIGVNTQVVYLKYSSDYGTALDRYGLRAADPVLRRAVRIHLNENLKAFNFAILIDSAEMPLAPPSQLAQVEVRGAYPDPTRHLLSNENSSTTKDVDNKVRNEYVGGFNSETEILWSAGHGGVFVSEHFYFSKIAASKLSIPLSLKSSSRFDQIFGPFAPELGGEPVARYPDSRDDAKATTAISTFAAMIAATTTHLIGVLVGLPAGVPDSQFKNKGDNGCYMDAGGVRTFEARAKLDGKHERFCPANDAYLTKILPLPR